MALQFGSTGYRAPRVPVRYPIPTIVSGTTPFQQRATPARNPAAAPVSQTLAQVANQRVNQQLAPQIAAQNAFNQRQNQVIQSFAEALLGKLQPQAGEVGQAYDSAIQQTGALSGAAAQYLNAQNPTGQVADLLKSINAPEAQQQQLAGQFGQTFGGGAGVLQFVGGAIPGGQLAADKAAAVSQAAQLPGLAALKGQQDLASALWQQGQDRRTLEAQRPGLYQQAAQDIRQNNAARAQGLATARRDAESIREFNVTRSDRLDAARRKAINDAAAVKRQGALDFVNKWIQLKKLGLDTTKLEQQYQHTLETERQGQQRIAISQQNANTSATRANNAVTPKYSASVSRSLGRRSDQYGHPINGGALLPGFKVGKNGVIVKVGSSGSKTKDKTLTPLELQSTTATIHDGLMQAKNGGNFDANGNPKAGGGYAKDGTPLPQLNRDGALSELRAHGYFATPQLAKIAMTELNRVFPPPSAPPGPNLFGASGRRAAKRATGAAANG